LRRSDEIGLKDIAQKGDVTVYWLKQRVKEGLPAVGIATLLAAGAGYAYPPAVGIVGPGRNCLSCHANNGPWTEEAKVIVDLLDKDTGKSLKQPDGTFLVQAKRNEATTLVTVIGRAVTFAVSKPFAVSPTRRQAMGRFTSQPGANLDNAAVSSVVGST